MKQPIRTRLAPSPSGSLHLGTARSALFNYLFTRKNKGKFILRIEDTDEKRSEEHYYEDIIRGLHWLGIEWDEGPDIGGAYGPYRQSQRASIYQPYIEKLLQTKSAYFCYCTKEELEAKRKRQIAGGEAPLYSKTCRELSTEQIKEKQASNPRPIIRFRNEQNGAITFNDIVRGPISTEAQLLGDFSIARDRTTPLFNLAVVIDDELMKITHVIRGEDHISNTPKQMLIIQALGFAIPYYAHLTLILNTDRSKLSKRKNQTSVMSYKEIGYLPQALVNFIAFLGWNPKTTQELFTSQELIDQFDLSKINKAGAIFDQKKLDWLNSQYIKKMSLADLEKETAPFLNQKGITAEKIGTNKLQKILTLEQSRIKKLAETGDNLDFLFQDIEYGTTLLPWKKKKMTVEETVRSLRQSLRCLEEIKKEGTTALQLETAFKTFIQKNDLQNGVILWPLRVALSGQEKSPSPFEIIWIIGRAKAKERVEQALKKLQGAG